MRFERKNRNREIHILVFRDKVQVLLNIFDFSSFDFEVQ